MMQINRASIKLAVAALILTTLACGGAAVTSTDQLSTIVAATLQAATAAASATPLPTNAAQPTATLIPTVIPPSVAPLPTSVPPTASNLPAGTRINFAAGTTEGVTQGPIQAGQSTYYIVRAFKGQPMIVQLSSPDQSVALSIFGANGSILLPDNPKTDSWQGILPATQDYYLRVIGGANPQNFSLNVVIPARVQFAPGQNTITLTGTTTGGFGVAYVAYAFAGQKMDVTINTDPNVAALTIWGFTDGQPYARAQNGVVDFSLNLPATQDYIIEAVPAAGKVLNFKVTIKIK